MPLPTCPIEGLVGEVTLNGTFIGWLMGVRLNGRRVTEQIRTLGTVRSVDVMSGRVDYTGNFRTAYICNDMYDLFESDSAFSCYLYPRGTAECGTLRGTVLFTGWSMENWKFESEAAKLDDMDFVIYNVETVRGLPVTEYEWYQVTDPDGTIGTHPAYTLTDGIDRTVYAQLYVPDDFSSLTSAYIVVVAGGSGNFRRSVSTNFGDICSENYNNHTDSIAAGQVAVTSSRLTCLDISAALTGLGAGDLVGIQFTREASNVNDTVNADCYYLGVLFVYTT